MKILVLIHEFPPVGGGGGYVALDIAKGLRERGHEIVLITAHIPGLAKDEIVAGMRVLRVPSLRRKPFQASFLSMAAYIVRGLWAGFRLLKTWRPDVIHVHFAVPAGGAAYALSRLTKIPYVLTAHLGDVPGGAPEKTEHWFRWLLPFTRPIWRDAAKAVAVSEFTRQLALAHYDVDVDVIHNGVAMRNVPNDKIVLQNPPRIIFAGRFAEQKNPLQIVRTLAELKDLPWECVLIGDGNLGEALRAEIHAYGLDERFRFTGWVTPAEVQKWLAKSDILFMPSLSEGLPVVGVQALAAGLALLVSNIGGFADLVDEGQNGFLVCEAEAYREHLQCLLSSPETLRAMRLASREKAQCFALDFVVAQYETLLQEAARNDD